MGYHLPQNRAKRTPARSLGSVAYVAEHKSQLALAQLQLAEQDYDPDVVRIAQEESARISKTIELGQ